MKPETGFRQRHVLRFLKTLKNTAYFSIQQRSISGHPDLMLCSNGIFVGLELKAENGVVSKLQKATLDKISEAGGIAIVARPSNWEEVKQQLTAIDGGYYESK